MFLGVIWLLHAEFALLGHGDFAPLPSLQTHGMHSRQTSSVWWDMTEIMDIGQGRKVWKKDFLAA